MFLNSSPDYLIRHTYWKLYHIDKYNKNCSAYKETKHLPAKIYSPDVEKKWRQKYFPHHCELQIGERLAWNRI
jgi:hypothetical protein